MQIMMSWYNVRRLNMPARRELEKRCREGQGRHKTKAQLWLCPAAV